jgi:hypothetical protein
VTRRLDGPSERIQKGDHIWIVGQLSSPWGRLPPSLDARIDVAAASKVITKTRGGEKIKMRHFKASGTSRWFPLADASKVLRRLKSRNKRGEELSLINNTNEPVGPMLQAIRELTIAEPLQAWERKLDSRGFDFVSYHLADGTQAAFKKVRSIVKRRGVVFWDRWSLPRRLAERRERLGEPELDRHIRGQIKRARSFWIIQSRGYRATGTYCKREFNWARKQGKLIACFSNRSGRSPRRP